MVGEIFEVGENFNGRRSRDHKRDSDTSTIASPLENRVRSLKTAALLHGEREYETETLVLFSTVGG